MCLCVRVWGLVGKPALSAPTHSPRKEHEHAQYLHHLEDLAQGGDSEAPSAEGTFERTLQDGTTVNVQMGAPLSNSTLWCKSKFKWGDQGVSEAS